MKKKYYINSLFYILHFDQQTGKPTSVLHFPIKNREKSSSWLFINLTKRSGKNSIGIYKQVLLQSQDVILILQRVHGN